MMSRLLTVLMLPLLGGCGDSQPLSPEGPTPPETRKEATAAPERPQEPAPTTVSQTAAPSAETVEEPVPRYSVRPGDTLYGIAQRRGLDYRDLAQWNAISNPDRIQPGQELRLGPPP